MEDRHNKAFKLVDLAKANKELHVALKDLDHSIEAIHHSWIEEIAEIRFRAQKEREMDDTTYNF